METHVFPLPGTILCCSSIRQNIKLDQERGGLNPSLLACCSQAKQLSLQFLQHLHFKQHYPCSATYPCPGKCPALKPECIKASEGQSSISSTVPTLCWFGIWLKKSELCSFEPPRQTILISSSTCRCLLCHINLTVTLLPNLAGVAQDIMNAHQKYKDDFMEGTCEVKVICDLQNKFNEMLLIAVSYVTTLKQWHKHQNIEDKLGFFKLG